MSDLTLNADDLPGIYDVCAEWHAPHFKTIGKSWLAWPAQWAALLPLDMPAARDLAVRYLASKGHDCHWARDIPGALAECCRDVGEGKEPRWKGVRGPWERLTDKRVARNAHHVVVRDEEGVWYWGSHDGADGVEESFEEAMKCADEAARAAGWWLL